MASEVFFIEPSLNNVDRILFVTSKENEPRLSAILNYESTPLYEISLLHTIFQRFAIEFNRGFFNTDTDLEFNIYIERVC